jgi:arsenate reductase
MIEELKKYCDEVINNFQSIPEKRKNDLDKITAYIKTCRTEKRITNLVFICTHNSRRSHFGQVWTNVAAVYYKIPGVFTYSGGTEVTAFHPNAIRALSKSGFLISKHQSGNNPLYAVYHSENADPLYVYSKLYDDADNPKNNFAAILTCSEAGEKCPVVTGADQRIELPFEDPKKYDSTPDFEKAYDDCCRQIATEMFYVFSALERTK